jgi:hypothetical protein
LNPRIALANASGSADPASAVAAAGLETDRFVARIYLNRSDRNVVPYDPEFVDTDPIATSSSVHDSNPVAGHLPQPAIPTIIDVAFIPTPNSNMINIAITAQSKIANKADVIVGITSQISNKFDIDLLFSIFIIIKGLFL